MTDKQIIIDGVDVSGCSCIIQDYQRANNIEGRYEHIKNVCELGERSAEYYNLFCKDNPNCYYKQLKRKEQECERLDNEAQNLFTEKTNLDIELSQLKAEIEELKRQHESDKGLITVTGKMNYELLLEYDKLTRLRETLTEIKEIVKIEACDALDGCIFCSNYHDCLNRVILQKISECEVDINESK